MLEFYFRFQGVYNYGKPGNLREFIISGKLRENSGNLKSTQGNFLYHMPFFSWCNLKHTTRQVGNFVRLQWYLCELLLARKMPKWLLTCNTSGFHIVWKGLLRDSGKAGKLREFHFAKFVDTLTVPTKQHITSLLTFISSSSFLPFDAGGL